jgi:16S rRNA processing protein RimM
MNINQLIQVGYILKPHGVRGVLKFISTVNLDEPFLDTNVLFLEQGQNKIPFIIETLEQTAPNEYLVKFEDINTKEEAVSLSKKQVSVTEEQYDEFVVEDESDSDYTYLIGFELLNQDMHVIGKIDDIMVLPEQELAQVFVNNREVLVPLQDDLILEINQKQHYIQVDIPEGLLELNLDE